MTTTVGVIGGSGLYELEGLDNVTEEFIETPFGDPSDAIVTGKLQGVDVCFLSRHGRGHRLSPSEINYRANIYALKTLGVEWCVSVSAVGSLIDECVPGHIVIPDQLIDRTRLRHNTFFQHGLVSHISFADPYCPVLSDLAATAAEGLSSELQTKVHRGGTLVCMEGPAFSTRAESHLYRSWGAHLIGMTALPEAKLAREAELAYTTIALVTDYDCWKEDEDAVEVAHIIETMNKNTANARKILAQLIPELSKHEPSEMAAAALKGAIITDPEQASIDAVDKLLPIVGKYFE